jgi:hypothetical protein
MILGANAQVGAGAGAPQGRRALRCPGAQVLGDSNPEGWEVPRWPGLRGNGQALC